MHGILEDYMLELRELTSEERKERIKFSQLAEELRKINDPSGFERLMNSLNFSQDEKDYILFNINNPDEIVKLNIQTFKDKVIEFKNNV